MLIVEELHMLLLRPDGRTESAVSVNRLYGEVAAVIVDLALHGRVTVSDEKNPVVEIVSMEPTGNPILDTTLQRLVPLRGKRLQSLVARPKLDPLEIVVESLVMQGVLVRGERGFFGWGSARTPESDPGPEHLLRSRLAAVLAGTAAPTQADLALLSILQNLDAAHAILREESGGLSSRELKKRITELTAGSAAGDAVAKAVHDAIAAAMVAIMTPTIVAATIT
ncbi:GOLPH3/VPS74 family protein [Microbacterium hydrocarbonoxydans]|uniref:Golgi phosphoprotein 3 (GPP34) n=1 Tax=Microbacterium hydrocarbonoxydans TaxID=273678 RepID=A0A1H4J302_9MICO|nr:GPP34 family phosphoprotein [Microbacterium hydrocarbonoxydans]SEB40435.1 Golgi phosphoprotein 3 (GPP34) [Microbacterium hydrocarbonoxydans]